jgi:hypothetical protein
MVTLRFFPPRTPDRQWRGTTGGSTRAWRNQRARILARDGYRCTAIERTTGARCTVAAPARLEVHHLHPGLGIESPDHQLATRCPRHNPRGAA